MEFFAADQNHRTPIRGTGGRRRRPRRSPDTGAARARRPPVSPGPVPVTGADQAGRLQPYRGRELTLPGGLWARGGQLHLQCVWATWDDPADPNTAERQLPARGKIVVI